MTKKWQHLKTNLRYWKSDNLYCFKEWIELLTKMALYEQVTYSCRGREDIFIQVRGPFLKYTDDMSVWIDRWHWYYIGCIFCSCFLYCIFKSVGTLFLGCDFVCVVSMLSLKKGRRVVWTFVIFTWCHCFCILLSAQNINYKNNKKKTKQKRKQAPPVNPQAKLCKQGWNTYGISVYIQLKRLWERPVSLVNPRLDQKQRCEFFTASKRETYTYEIKFYLCSSRSRIHFFIISCFKYYLPETKHSSMSKLFVKVARKSCLLGGRTLGADPSSRWAAFCLDNLSLERKGRDRQKDRK